jgi:hypothetical protein
VTGFSTDTTGSEIFEAIQARFEGDASLKHYGRKLYEGYGERRLQAPPCVVVTCTAISDELDTFDADIDVYSLDFAIHSPDHRSRDAARIQRHLMRVYDDALIESDVFDAAGMNRTGASGPAEEDGSYDASVSYDLTVTWKEKRPLERMV